MISPPDRCDYRNVYQCAGKPAEWLALEKHEKRRVFTPCCQKRFVDVRLPQGWAAHIHAIYPLPCRLAMAPAGF